ncbi:MAG: phosphate/phosphite/phosphonate ABC transporter substrate-binding protein [Opitutaceae bacterium]
MRAATTGKGLIGPSLSAFAIVIGLAGGAGCSQSDAVGNDSGRPEVLLPGWAPNEEEPERRVRLEVFTQYLEKRLKMPVDLVQTGSYSAEIEALRAGKIHAGTFSPFAYIIGRERAPIDPLIIAGQPDGRHNTYRSVLIVPASSPLYAIGDVKERAASLTMAWVDPASASGHLVPRVGLEAHGVAPERDFKRTVFTLSHVASAMTTKAGKVDLAATSLNSLTRLIEKGRIAPGEVRVIWESEPIVTSVTVVHGKLPAAFRAELRQAYLDFRADAPEAWAQYNSRVRTPNTIWLPASDRDFDGLRELARSVPHLDLFD